MKKADCIKFLQALGAPNPNTERKGWVRCNCPFAPWKHSKGTDKDPSFGVEIQNGGQSRGWCFSCRSSGDLYGIILEIQHLNKMNPSGKNYDFKEAMALVANEDEATDTDDLLGMLLDLEEPEPDLFEFSSKWMNTLTKPAYYVGQAVHPYLRKRGVTKEIAEMLDIRFDPSKNRICFPIIGFDGKLYGLHGRALDNSNPLRYFAYEYLGSRNPSVWMNEVNFDFDNTLVITEGQFDLASIARVYPNVGASQTSSLNRGKMKRISPAQHIVSFYDHGQGGDRAREYLDEYFADSEVALHHVIPTEEQGDAGDMSEDEIYEHLSTFL